MGIGAFLKLGKEEDVMTYLLVWFVSGAFVILRGTISHLVGVEWLDIDLIPIFLVYLIGKDQDLRAGFLAFFMGLLAGLFTPCQLGLFAFAYSAVLVGIIHCRRFLDLTKIRTTVLLVALFVVAKWSVLLVVVRILPLGRSIPSIAYLLVFISALLTSIVAPFLFYLLNLVSGGEKRSYA
jgi:hypothetical protein